MWPRGDIGNIIGIGIICIGNIGNIGNRQQQEGPGGKKKKSMKSNCAAAKCGQEAIAISQLADTGQRHPHHPAGAFAQHAKYRAQPKVARGGHL